MIDSIQQSPLYRIVNPRSVAFFGASNRFAAMGTNLLSSLISMGFEGGIYPIHPSEKQVQNLTAFKSVLDLPEVPDVAVMVLPTRLRAGWAQTVARGPLVPELPCASPSGP